jgi:hypothetical protein
MVHGKGLDLGTLNRPNAIRRAYPITQKVNGSMPTRLAQSDRN